MREEIREELGSDYDSHGGCDDVTRYKESAPKYGFQLESQQNELIQKVLQQITKNPWRSVPAFGAAPDPVDNWLCDPVGGVPTPAVGDTDNIREMSNVKGFLFQKIYQHLSQNAVKIRLRNIIVAISLLPLASGETFIRETLPTKSTQTGCL